LISIIPEHAPPGSPAAKLKLIVADDVVAQFEAKEAVLVLSAYAEDLLNDIRELEQFKMVPGRVTLESLNIALNFMVVTYTDETEEHVRYTEMFRKLVKTKFIQEVIGL